MINAASAGHAAFRAAPNAYNTAPRNIVLKNNIFVLAPSSARPMVHLYNYVGTITSDSTSGITPAAVTSSGASPPRGTTTTGTWMAGGVG